MLRWFAGLAVVAALVTAYDVDQHAWMLADREGELSRLAAAAVVRLPDGRYAMMSGAYGHATTCRTTADADHMDHTSYAMPFVHHIALCGAAYHKLIVQDAAWPGWRQWPLGEEARRTADHMDASMASPLRGGAAAQLVARLAPAEADVVRDALRPHMTRLPHGASPPRGSGAHGCATTARRTDRGGASCATSNAAGGQMRRATRTHPGSVRERARVLMWMRVWVWVWLQVTTRCACLQTAPPTRRTPTIDARRCAAS